MSHRILRKPFKSSLAIAISMTCGTCFAAEPIVNLPSNFEAISISADGRTIAGHLRTPTDPWTVDRFQLAWVTEAGSLAAPDAPDLSTYRYRVSGIDADGSTIVGTRAEVCTSFCRFQTAFRWTQQTGFELLAPVVAIDAPGRPSRYNQSTARGVSGDGGTVVGASLNGFLEHTATVWRTGMPALNLGQLPGHRDSIANAASHDGSVVVGASCTQLPSLLQTTGCQAFRWNQSSGLRSLGELNGSSAGSIAIDVSADGNTITGNAGLQAFRWREADGMSALGFLAGHAVSRASAISADGNVIVGSSGFRSVAGTGQIEGARAFRWTQSTGMQSIDAWLGEHGVVLPTGLLLTNAVDTNRDGNIVIGQGRNTLTEMDTYWLARIKDGTAGVITDLPAFTRSLDMTSHAVARNAFMLPRQSLMYASRRSLFDEGLSHDERNCGWIAASIHHDDDDGVIQQSREIGGCRLFDRLRMGLGIVRITARESHSGLFSSRSTIDQLILRAGFETGRMARVDIAAARTEFDMRTVRAYLNGNRIDSSIANPSGHAWSIRVTGTAHDAWRIGKTSISPYASLDWMRSESDPFEERLGAFAATFSGSNQESASLSLGMKGAIDINDRTRLLPSVEISRALSSSPATIRADPGVPLAAETSFEHEERTFGRAGIDLDHRIGASSSLRLSMHVDYSGSARYGLGGAYTIHF